MSHQPYAVTTAQAHWRDNHPGEPLPMVLAIEEKLGFQTMLQPPESWFDSVQSAFVNEGFRLKRNRHRLPGKIFRAVSVLERQIVAATREQTLHEVIARLASHPVAQDFVRALLPEPFEPSTEAAQFDAMVATRVVIDGDQP